MSKDGLRNKKDQIRETRDRNKKSTERTACRERALKHDACTKPRDNPVDCGDYNPANHPKGVSEKHRFVLTQKRTPINFLGDMNIKFRGFQNTAAGQSCVPKAEPCIFF
jgi:hypothetical protein